MKKNIILLSNAYYPSIGGIENSLRHLAEEAINANDSVKIIVSDIGLPSDYKNRYIDKIDGVEVLRYPLAPAQSKFTSLFNFFISHSKLLEILKKEYSERPDSIIIARFHSVAQVAKKAGFKNVKYIVPSIVQNQLKVEVKDGLVGKIRSKLKVAMHNRIQKQALLNSENFVFSSSMLAQCKELACNNDSDYQITKPGVDPKRFFPLQEAEKHELKRSLGIGSENPVILFVGRYVKAKGCDLLIQAIKAVPNCQLVMIGDGEEKESYLSLIKQLGISDRVKVLSPTKNVEQFYQAADIFAMTSNYEPLGQTILEALCTGLKIVAFRKGDSVDTATEELGFNEYINYSAEHKVSGLSVAITNALADLSEHKPQEAHLKVSTKFSWKNLYQEVSK